MHLKVLKMFSSHPILQCHIFTSCAAVTGQCCRFGVKHKSINRFTMANCQIAFSCGLQINTGVIPLPTALIKVIVFSEKVRYFGGS